MSGKLNKSNRHNDKRTLIPAFIAGFSIFFAAAPCLPADIIIIGDTQLKPVVDIISGVRKTVNRSVSVYTPSEIRGRLRSIVEKEGSRAVIALGRDAIDDALRLPESIAVIYDLVVLPLKINRPNTTGVYMATPVNEYVGLTRKFLPALRRISVVSTPTLQKTLGAEDHSPIALFHANSPFELVSTVNQLNATDALLLLPDLSLLTSSALEEIYLYSFRNKVPVLGISEKHVKHGALFALVFDSAGVGKHIGEITAKALSGANIGHIPASPSRKFDLYINSDTAVKMGIDIPDEMLRRAKKVYPSG